MIWNGLSREASVASDSSAGVRVGPAVCAPTLWHSKPVACGGLKPIKWEDTHTQKKEARAAPKWNWSSSATFVYFNLFVLQKLVHPSHSMREQQKCLSLLPIHPNRFDLCATDVAWPAMKRGWWSSSGKDELSSSANDAADKHPTPRSSGACSPVPRLFHVHLTKLRI